MTYEQICEQNKYLYEKLERLGWMKRNYVSKGMDDLYKDTCIQFDYVNEMINNNLDKMEALWIGVNRQETKISDPDFTKLERRILDSWLKKGSQCREIASSLNLSLGNVHETVMKFVEHRIRIKKLKA